MVTVGMFQGAVFQGAKIRSKNRKRKKASVSVFSFRKSVDGCAVAGSATLKL